MLGMAAYEDIVTRWRLALSGHEPSVTVPAQIGADTGTLHTLRLLDQFDHDAFAERGSGLAIQHLDAGLKTPTPYVHRLERPGDGGRITDIRDR